MAPELKRKHATLARIDKPATTTGSKSLPKPYLLHSIDRAVMAAFYNSNSTEAAPWMLEAAPSVEAWNQAIHRCAQSSQWKQAIALLGSLEGRADAR